MATPSFALDRTGSRGPRWPSGALLAGRYRPEGGTADRVRAVDRTSGERVFIKFGSRRPRSASEADLLARLEHPGIVRLKDSGSDGDRPFIVLEWIDGSDLETVLTGSD